MDKPIAKKLDKINFRIIGEVSDGYLCIKDIGKEYLLDLVFYCPKNKGENIYAEYGNTNREKK